MVLESDITYGHQSEWVDTANDQLWTAPLSEADGRSSRRHKTAMSSVYLLLREQEVGAVEDPALRDVALGGPDTAERRRILQRSCVTPSSDQLRLRRRRLTDSEQPGRRSVSNFEPHTMRLKSSATLQVSFQEPVHRARRRVSRSRRAATSAPRTS